MHFSAFFGGVTAFFLAFWTTTEINALGKYTETSGTKTETYEAELTEPSLTLPHRGCYFVSWARYRPEPGLYLPQNVDPNLCTIILYAFGQITNNEVAVYDWKDEDNFNDLVTLKNQNPDLKVVLSVGGWTLSSQFPPMAASPANRQSFVQSCVTKLRQWKLDGVDIDWEYPTVAQKNDFSALMQELRAAFDQESQQTGQPRLILSAAVGAVNTDGYDISTLNSALDFVNVMTYDFHGAGWEPSQTGHNSPLYPSSSDPNQLSVSGSLQKWVGLGMPKSKINMGLGFYGRSWTLSDANNHAIGSPANGPAPAGPLSREAGVYGFNEICTDLQSGKLTSVFDEQVQAPYAYGGTTWVGYDDEKSITLKAKYIMENGFAGGFIWELSTDDFHGSCYGKPNILLVALKNGLTETDSSVSTNPPGTPTTPETSTNPTITTNATTVSTASSSGHACNYNFCKLNGVGSFALGPCQETYCDCGDGFFAYLRRCPAGAGLIFDQPNGYCNWRYMVSACKP